MSARFRGGLTLAIAYCALIWAFGGSPARSQDSCPVPDPGVTLEARWMVDRVCACASLQPGDPACECEKRKYIATIVSAFTEQAPKTATPEPTSTFVWPTPERATATRTPRPTLTDTPLSAIRAEATPTASRTAIYMPRATKGRK